MKKFILITLAVGLLAIGWKKFGGQQTKLVIPPEKTIWGLSKADSSISPFAVKIDAKAIEDLKRRLAQWRRHEVLAGVGYDYGFAGDQLDDLVKYWREKYDLTKFETRLNALPQFTTVIQGLKVHFIHAKGDPKATTRIPLILVHGFPGSVAEFYGTIPKLTAVDAEGVAFDVVAPSIPGYGFSEAASKPGFNPLAAAQLFHLLMKRLGYERYVYQGGDWGSIIGGFQAKMYPESVIGYHSNFIMPPTQTVLDQLHFGAAMLAPSFVLGKSDAHKLDKVNLADLLEDTGYFHVQATKPDTLAVALSDSPVGLASWITNLFVKFTERAEFKGDVGGVTNDDLLTNIMVYWFSNHFASAARFYKETVQSMKDIEAWAIEPFSVPTGVACYPFEGLCSPRALLKRQMPKLVHYADISHGGHFAAAEEPELFAEDVRAAAKAFLKANEVKPAKDKAEKKDETKATPTASPNADQKPSRKSEEKQQKANVKKPEVKTEEAQATPRAEEKPSTSKPSKANTKKTEKTQETQENNGKAKVAANDKSSKKAENKPASKKEN